MSAIHEGREMEHKSRELTFHQAITEALRQEMERNKNIFLMGEDVRSSSSGFSFGVCAGLVDRFGPERVIDTPISEMGFIGASIGAAATGLRPVTDLMFSDFCGVAFDQILNQGAKLRYMFGGKAKVPLVIRAAFGAGLSAAAHHSQCLYSFYVHIPGLKCVVPSTPYDAKGLLISALRQDDPVMYLEHKYLYETIKGPVPEEEYTIPFGQADVKREGKDATLVGIGWMVHKALEAAEILREEKIDIEVVDPRTLSPLDEKTILRSVEKTGKIAIVDEDYPRCSVATDIAALVADKAFDSLDAPIKCVTAPHTPVPFSPVLEKAYVPDAAKIVKAVREMVG
jgi:pyruvate/2-oxoglutarate/acetoin dehydrogenase E1 component